MTAHQQSKLNQLARDYASTEVDQHGLAVWVKCYDVTTPDLRGVAPVARFRISPSGFKQRIDPVAP